MPITDQELRDNYYLAVVVYLCNYASPYSATDSSTGDPWAFALADNGNEPHPNPYISSWDIKSHERPSDYPDGDGFDGDDRRCSCRALPAV